MRVVINLRPTRKSGLYEVPDIVIRHAFLILFDQRRKLGPGTDEGEVARSDQKMFETPSGVTATTGASGNAVVGVTAMDMPNGEK